MSAQNKSKTDDERSKSPLAQPKEALDPALIQQARHQEFQHVRSRKLEATQILEQHFHSLNIPPNYSAGSNCYPQSYSSLPLSTPLYPASKAPKETSSSFPTFSSQRRPFQVVQCESMKLYPQYPSQSGRTPGFIRVTLTTVKRRCERASCSLCF